MGDFSYSIVDISERAKVTKQSLYALFSKNRELIDKNSKHLSKKIMYNQTVLNFVLQYYGYEQEQAEPDQELVTLQDKLREATEKADEQSKELATLQAKLREVTEEKDKLYITNQQLLLLLQQEKQTQILLLQRTNKSVWQRIREAWQSTKS